jgi:hypothetical protein
MIPKGLRETNKVWKSEKINREEFYNQKETNHGT